MVITKFIVFFPVKTVFFSLSLISFPVFLEIELLRSLFGYYAIPVNEISSGKIINPVFENGLFLKNRQFEFDLTDKQDKCEDEIITCRPKILINPGSVGQPRYGFPEATYAIAEITNDSFITRYRSVEYDFKEMQKRMKEKGFPKKLIDRLSEGR
ncbi:hypothetical protein JW851_03665 [Candidatus Woesearchaeota archaeon]|nr:hypothetical protein [Candidatus Woesearchaeota archaeon]